MKFKISNGFTFKFKFFWVPYRLVSKTIVSSKLPKSFKKIEVAVVSGKHHKHLHDHGCWKFELFLDFFSIGEG